MPGLCPRCGEQRCSHTAAERGQNDAEYAHDLVRDLTDNERVALASGNKFKKIQAAADFFITSRIERLAPRILGKS